MNKRHPSWKEMYTLASILRLDNINSNSILKKRSSHLNKDGLHLNSYGTIKTSQNFYIKDSDVLM